MRRDAEPAVVDGGGSHVVDEAPGTDGTAVPARQRASHGEVTDLAGATLRDLDDPALDVGRLGVGGCVGGRDRAAHVRSLDSGSTRQMPARYPPARRSMSSTAGSPPPVLKISSVSLVVSRLGRAA